MCMIDGEEILGEFFVLTYQFETLTSYISLARSFLRYQDLIPLL